jgi:hypothetical protein
MLDPYNGHHPETGYAPHMLDHYTSRFHVVTS